MQDPSTVSMLLAAQYRDLRNYWDLKDIFEYTRGVSMLPRELESVMQLKMITENNPEIVLSKPEVEALSTKVHNRGQALLNLKNMALHAKKTPGFRGSPAAVMIETLAVRQFFSDQEIQEATKPAKDDQPAASSGSPPASAPVCEADAEWDVLENKAQGMSLAT